MKEHLSVFLKELREAPRRDPNVPIYTHGEKEVLSYEKRMKEGISIDPKTVGEMVDICRDLHMDSMEYLGV